MSRFTFDYDYDPELSADAERNLEAAYAASVDKLAAFLVHLDAMPSRRIVSGRFYVAKTGDACAVAEYCKSVGVAESDLRRAQSKTIKECVEGDDEMNEGGWSNATVMAGVAAGLPQEIAFDLAWKTDNWWKQVQTGTVPCTCADFANFHEAQCRFGFPVRRRMRPDERWLALRNFVAEKVGAPALELVPT